MGTYTRSVIFGYRGISCISYISYTTYTLHYKCEKRRGYAFPHAYVLRSDFYTFSFGYLISNQSVCIVLYRFKRLNRI